jgi:hypothetical protein
MCSETPEQKIFKDVITRNKNVTGTWFILNLRPFRLINEIFYKVFCNTWNLRDKNLGSVVLFLFWLGTTLKEELDKQFGEASRFGSDLHPGTHVNDEVKAFSK